MYQFNHTKSPISIKRSILIGLNYIVGYMYLYPLIIVWISEKILKTYDYIVYMELFVFILVFITTIILAKPIFEESSYNGVDNRRDNFLYAAKSLSIMYFWMFVLNIIINLITQQATSDNQVNILNMSNSYPMVTFIMAVVLAPLVEEVVFRGVIFRKLRDHGYILAIIISSLMFGLAHVYSSLLSGNYLDLLYIFTYSMLGYFLALNYERSGNIYISIGLHTAINFISMLLVMLARVVG